MVTTGTDITPRPLTLRALLNLSFVAEVAMHSSKVALVREEGRILYGTARSIGTEQGGFAGHSDDVREQYLRITTREGLEVFLPVLELANAHDRAEFVTYDWS